MALLLADTRGLTDMAIPDKSDRSSTVKIDCLNSAKLDEKISESLQIQTLLLGFNTVNDDKKKMTLLIPADSKTRGEELDEALSNVLLASRGIDIALTLADKPATTLNKLLEACLLDEALIAVTSNVFAIMSDTEHDAALGDG